MTKSKGIIKRFTTEEDNYIIQNYLSLSGPLLATNLNRAEGSVYGRMERLNLKLPAEIMDYNKHYDLYAKVGKTKSGNLIDGKIYQEFPQI